VIAKGKLVGALAGAGAAAAVLFPASAGAQGVCDNGVPGCEGQVTALTALADNPTSNDETAVSIIENRLAGNHNETVLLLD
jgi:hypothetical protein